MVHNITSKWNAFRNSAAKLQQFGDIREVLITSYLTIVRTISSAVCIFEINDYYLLGFYQTDRATKAGFGIFARYFVGAKK